MVRSNLCWLEGKKKGDCEFDNGGYFVIKGAEKFFVAQEQLCLKRLWVSDQPSWNIVYRHELSKLRVVIRVEDIEEPKHLQGTKILNVYFLSCKIPLWIFLFALGMSSDKEIFEMINICERDASSVNLLTSTIGYADYQYEGFRRGNNLKRIGEWISETKKPPKESTRECIDMFLFPSLKSLKLKSLFLLYMVKCLLQSYSGKRQCDNRDDFRNKRLDLAGELLERELHSHVKHAERTMVIRIQKALDGNKDLNPIDCYFDASAITNGLNRAFSTGGWSHHLKRERISGVVANLRRTNPLQMICDMRKTRQQVQYAGWLGDARFPLVRLLLVTNSQACMAKKLLEAALGKGIAAGGLTRYATPFTTPSVEVIKEQLHRAGFQRWGNEKFCSGHNGKMVEKMLFIGPTFYQRLNHMAEDKVKYRNTGPVHPLTRQPVQDRKRFGGVTFGEMERDCLLAHGAAANLCERLFTLSDLSQMQICNKCSNIAKVIQRQVPGGGKIRGPYCRFCESAETILKVKVPYGAKLLCQELFSRGICVKFGTEPC